MKQFHLIITSIVIFSASAPNLSLEHYLLGPGYVDSKQPRNTFRDGDLIIGGLVSPHVAYNQSSKTCYKLSFPPIKRALAILYAIDRINQDKHLLPNIKLGYDLRDICGKANLASIQSLYFITNSLEGNSQMCTHNNRPINASSPNRHNKRSYRSKIAAIVGPQRSGNSVASATLLSHFDIAQVSYGSTSRILGDKVRFNTFFRTVPSDIYQAQAIVDILKYFHWNYVALIAVDDGYGDLLASSFSSLSLQHGICISIYRALPLKWTKIHTQKIVHELLQHPQVKVILLLCSSSDAGGFLQEALQQNLKGRIFIGSDAWGYGRGLANKYASVLDGALLVAFPTQSITNFYNYLNHLNVCQMEQTYPWLFQYLQQHMNDMQDNKSNCTHMQLIYRQLLRQDPQNIFAYEDYVIDAVYTVAHAIHRSLGCNHVACPRHNLLHFKSIDVVNAFYNLTFQSITSNLIQIDSDGQAHGKYLILHNQFDAKLNQHQFKIVGRWEYHSIHQNNSKLTINDTLISWYQNPKLASIPISQCSQDCLPGQYRQYLTDMSCCWKCLACPMYSISNATNSHLCYTCDLGMIPNANQSQCILINVTHLTISDPLTICLITTIMTSIGCVIIVWSIFLKYQHTAVVRASNSLFTNYLLAGILLTYLTPTLLILPITSLTCNLTYISFLTSLAYVMAVILAKTHLLIEIFFPGCKLDKIMRTILRSKKVPQITIIAVTITLTAVIQIIALTTYPLRSARYIYNNHKVYAFCTADTRFPFGMALGFMLKLNIICIIYAYKTRKLPQNFNEARYIYFVSITMCLALSVIFPSYLVARGPIQVGIAAFSNCALSMILLLCLFGPKLFIILCRPQLNRKQQVVSDVAHFSLSSKKYKNSNEDTDHVFIGTMKSILRPTASANPPTTVRFNSSKSCGFKPSRTESVV